MRELRADQSAALQSLRDTVGSGIKRIVMQAPTGFGKTVLSSDLIESARGKNKKVLFTVPAISLVDQTVEMFASQGIRDVGVIQATHRMTDWSQPIQVASVQTLQKRTLPEADVVLIDEVHQWFKFYEKWLCDPAWAKVPMIGLSATPWTKGLGGYFQKLIIAATTAELIAKKLLSDFQVFAPSHPDLSGIKTTGGDYQQDQLSNRMQSGGLTGDIVKTWLNGTGTPGSVGKGRPTLCYAVDRAHAKHLQKMFIEAGVRCGYQDAFTKDNDRRDKKTGEMTDGRKTIKRKFHTGEYEIVVNVGTLTTGIDWDVRCIIGARPTKSEKLLVQIDGRGLRTADGKDYCLMLDHSDNHSRLGFVTDIDASHSELYDGKTPESETFRGIRLPKECPKCAFLKAPGMAVCPNCEWRVEAHCKIEPAPGELKKLERAAKKKDKTIVLNNRSDHLIFYAELKGYAIGHGYKDGWAANKYREYTEHWPHSDIKHCAPMRNISAVTASWIKSRQIAWAKSKHRPRFRNDNVQNDRAPLVAGTLMTEQDMMDFK